MAHNAYIAGFERRSGKSIVLLGVMELLSHRIHKLGVFRPIIRDSETPDNDIQLVRDRFDLQAAYESCFGCSYDQARDLVTAGRYGELLERIVERYKRLERECDFVLCEGTDFTGVSTAFEFDFNVDVAKHLGAPLLVIINARGKAEDQILDAAHAVRGVLDDDGCPIAATFVNRAEESDLEGLRARLREQWPFEDPVFVLPERESLSRLTVRQVAQALDGTVVHGEQAGLDQEVTDYKVAAMHLPHFLQHISAGSLIITPGDRSDIILGSVASVYADTYPPISGIVLTGGLQVAPEVKKLLEGIHVPGVPIVSVETDTYTTATRVGELQGVIHPTNAPRVATALGVFESSVDQELLMERLAAPRSRRVTPLMFEYELIERARGERQHIVLPEGTDPRILQAADILRRRDVVELTLLGNRQSISERMASLGLQLDDVQIVDPDCSDWHEQFAEHYWELRRHKGISREQAHDMLRDVSYFGTMMVLEDLADGMVSGAAHTTAHTIRPAFEVIRTKPGCSIVSSVFLMCLPDRVLVYGDCAIIPNPTPEQLADIAVRSAETAQMFNIEPRVAMLSYSTGESGSGEDVERVRKATELAREARPDLPIDGPIQYDAAVDASVAATKMPDSNVAGRATVFVFPDLNTGNNTYKAVQRTAGAVAVGPVLQGLKKPINDLSRGCTVRDIVNTVAITAIQAQAAKAEQTTEQACA